MIRGPDINNWVNPWAARLFNIRFLVVAGTKKYIFWLGLLTPVQEATILAGKHWVEANISLLD